jgi:RNA polymerase sigma factor (sigma-70 family)
MAEPSKTFIERLFAHRGALQAFFYRRLRIKSDAADLVQEVYLRMLRVADPQAIRNPEAYLFTVAGNLLRENAVADLQRAQSAPVEDAEGTPQFTQIPGFEADLDTERRVARMCKVIEELSPKCCAAVVMQYRHELSYEEIAVRLGVSPRMVKKYLTQALNHFRKRMERLR